MTFQALCERNHRRAAELRRGGWRVAAASMAAAAVAGGVAGGPAAVEAAGGPATGTPQAVSASSGGAQARAERTAEPRRMFRRYCIGCHNDRLRTADLSIAALDVDNVPADAETWEKVVTRLRAGSMPPPGRPRPDEATYRHVAEWLESEPRQRLGRRTLPGPDQRHPPHQPHGVPQRHSRPAGARRRRRIAPAGRRDRRRQLRQLRGRPRAVDRAHRALSLGRAAGDPAGHRTAAAESRRRHVRDLDPHRAGHAAGRRPAAGVARRGRHPVPVSGRRRVPRQGAAAAPISGLPDGDGLAAVGSTSAWTAGW